MDDPKVNKLYLVLEYMRRGDLMKIRGRVKAYSCKPARRRRHVARDAPGRARPEVPPLAGHHPRRHQAAEPARRRRRRRQDRRLWHLQDAERRRQAIDTAGTPAFMSPELCDGKHGPHADVWAFGGTMFMLRFGRPHTSRRRCCSSTTRSSTTRSSSPADAAPVDEGLRDMLGAMLTKDPSDRIAPRGRARTHGGVSASRPVARAGAAARTARARARGRLLEGEHVGAEDGVRQDRRLARRDLRAPARQLVESHGFRRRAGRRRRRGGRARGGRRGARSPAPAAPAAAARGRGALRRRRRRTGRRTRR